MPKTYKQRSSSKPLGKMATRKGNVFRNPTTSLKKAIQLSEKFHGRKVNTITNITEVELYESNLSKLADLVELEILCDEGATVLPIKFKDCGIKLSSNIKKQPDGEVYGTQLYFIDGDQKLDLDECLGEEYDPEKRFLIIGPSHSITYWTDKWHLVGPKYQQTGAEFEHMFGEENGELPTLVYDGLNCRMLLVGGSYKVEAEGIKN